jgi:hypothetical protein
MVTTGGPYIRRPSTLREDIEWFFLKVLRLQPAVTHLNVFLQRLSDSWLGSMVKNLASHACSVARIDSAISYIHSWIHTAVDLDRLAGFLQRILPEYVRPERQNIVTFVSFGTFLCLASGLVAVMRIANLLLARHKRRISGGKQAKNDQKSMSSAGGGGIGMNGYNTKAAFRSRDDFDDKNSLVDASRAKSKGANNHGGGPGVNNNNNNNNNNNKSSNSSSNNSNKNNTHSRSQDSSGPYKDNHETVHAPAHPTTNQPTSTRKKQYKKSHSGNTTYTLADLDTPQNSSTGQMYQTQNGNGNVLETGTPRSPGLRPMVVQRRDFTVRNIQVLTQVCVYVSLLVCIYTL